LYYTKLNNIGFETNHTENVLDENSDEIGALNNCGLLNVSDVLIAEGNN